MHSPVPLALAKTLADKASERVAWLRFDFRGVGASEGKYDEGRGEVDDALAALAFLRERAPGIPVSVVGHSFGSWVGLRAAWADGHVDRLLLVSPSVRFFDFAPADTAWSRPGSGKAGDLPSACPVTIFVGDQDDLLDVPEAQALAAKLGATLRIFDGYDHHFMKSRRAMAEAALPVLVPGL
jgi:alpha/beta superfamily hydrolase